MPSVWRTVRVFISSTFRDMHAERDHLVKVVFPALRERLERHRIYLDDIDLRWGLTREQAENEQVIELCLREIERCEPFFVGILGDRYGWTPDTLPARVVASFNWITSFPGVSVTELEILHGVLNSPILCDRSFFYFRDTLDVADMGSDQLRETYAESDSGRAARLAGLKDRIRACGRPVMDPYPAHWDAGTGSQGRLVGLGPFGERVREQLWEAIKQKYDLPDSPAAETAPDPLAEEADYHDRFIQSRLRVHVPRQGLHGALTAHVGSEEAVVCLVTGASGSGKSASLARFVTDYRRAHPDALVISHFIGASPRSGNLRDLLRRFCQIFQSQLGLAGPLPDEVARLTLTFRELLGKVPSDVPVLVVIDALDRLDEADHARLLAWLPDEFPRHVKILVSCISDPVTGVPALDAFARRRHVIQKVEPLDDQERRGIIREVPSLSAKTLDDHQVDLLLANPATTNPLFLLVSLEELRGFGSYERLNERIAAFPREGDTVTNLFEQVIERLEEEFTNPVGVVRTVLTSLAMARRGLSDRELLDLVEGPEVPISASQSDLFPILRQLRPYLLRRAGLIDFYHRNLADAVVGRYLSSLDSKRVEHARLATYFQGRSLRSGSTPRRQITHRKCDELPWQLMRAGRAEELAVLLEDGDFLVQLWELSELDCRTYWTEILRETERSPVSAYREVLDSPSSNPPLARAVALLLHSLSLEAFAIPVWEVLVGDARRRQDRPALIEWLPRYASSLARFGRRKAAHRLHRELHDLSLEMRNPRSLATAVAGIASYEKDLGKFDAAERRFRLAQHLTERWGDAFEAQVAIQELPDIYLKRGEHQRALAELCSFERECERCGNLDEVMRARNNQALALFSLGRNTESRELLLKLVDWWRSVGSLWDLQNALGNLANTYSETGELQRALELHVEEERICRQLGGTGLRICLRNQARIYMRIGKRDVAERLFWDAYRAGWDQIISRADHAPRLFLWALRPLAYLKPWREWREWQEAYS